MLHPWNCILIPLSGLLSFSFININLLILLNLTDLNRDIRPDNVALANIILDNPKDSFNQNIAYFSFLGILNRV